MVERGQVLPERMADGLGSVLRRLHVDDAEILHAAVLESLEHLAPWMAWVALEPLTIEQRRAMLIEWERDWSAGGDVLLGVFVDSHLAGGCGLHRRIGADGLELGYWIHPGFTGRGVATRVGSLLIDAAFASAEITHVEIHTDKANLASARVASKLGFALVEEVADEPQAPAEIGIECRWRLERPEGTRPRSP